MKLDQKIVERFDELIAQGSVVASNHAKLTPDLTQWIASSRNLIVIVTGKGSEHVRQFDNYVGRHLSHGAQYSWGVLRSVREEYARGFLTKLRTLVEADVFFDLMEQAEYLLDKKYYAASAIIAGSVLEDALRTLCQREGVTFPVDMKHPMMSDLNTGLYKKEFYEKNTWSNINSLITTRNSAAHGKTEEYKPEDVKRMVPAIREFLVKYYS